MVLKISGFPTYRTNQIAVKGPARDVAGGVFAVRQGQDDNNFEVDYDNNVTDLYKYVSNCQWADALKTINENPVEAKTWVVRYHEDATQGMMWRFLPLHSACARQPPLEIVNALINIYPEGAQAPDDQGKYALHYACGNQASKRVIEVLIDAYPTAARTSDPEGKLPLHWMAISGPSDIGALEPVITASGKLYQIVDDEGWTPLDYAKSGEYFGRGEVVELLQRPYVPSPSHGRSTGNFHPSQLVLSPKKSKGSQISMLSLSSDFSSLSRRASTPSTRSVSTTGTRGSVNKTVAKLNAQIVKLRAEENFNAAELDEALVNAKEAHEEAVDDMNQQIIREVEENRKVRQDISSKEQFTTHKENRTNACDRELTHFKDQNAKLEREIDAANEECRMQRSIIHAFEMRIRTLSSKMAVMTDEQTKIISNLVSIEDDMKKQADARRQKLQDLFDDDLMDAKECAKLKRVYGSPTSPVIRQAMMQQNELMKNCADVLNMCDFTDDILSSPSRSLSNLSMDIP